MSQQPFSSDNGFVTVGNITSATFINTPVALATLTAVAGGRAFINDSIDAAAGNFGAVATDGGTEIIPVWSDGINWYIG